MMKLRDIHTGRCHNGDSRVIQLPHTQHGQLPSSGCLSGLLCVSVMNTCLPPSALAHGLTHLHALDCNERASPAFLMSSKGWLMRNLYFLAQNEHCLLNDEFVLHTALLSPPAYSIH